jgi:hypothetical protein
VGWLTREKEKEKIEEEEETGTLAGAISLVRGAVNRMPLITLAPSDIH